MKNIMVFQFKRMGDLVQTMPLLRRLREEYPESRITLACFDAFKGILDGWDGYDRLIPIRIMDLKMLSETARPETGGEPDSPLPSPFDGIRAFRETYDLLLNLSPDPGASILAERIKAVRKLGCIRGENATIRRFGHWTKYEQAMVGYRKENPFNRVDMHMGMSAVPLKAMRPVMPVTDQALQDARALLRAHGWNGTGKLIALQTGASGNKRTWPMDRFADLAQRLNGDGDVNIVLFGDGRERRQTELLQESVAFPIINLAGKTKVSDLAALCKCCDLVVGNDTGTLHIAAAVGTRTLGLFFSTAYFAETGPYGEGHALMQVEIPCAPCHPSSMCQSSICKDYIDADSVHAAIRWLLAPDNACAPPPSIPSVSLYRSRFLSNGMIAYLPVETGSVSGHYLTGLLGRLLWESAFEIAHDETMESLWFASRGRFGWKAECRKAAGIFSILSAPIRGCLHLAGQLRAELAKPFPESSQIRILEARMTDNVNELTTLGVKSGLCGIYILFEMLDMDYQAFPEMASVFERKFQSLNEMLSRMSETLTRVAGD